MKPTLTAIENRIVSLETHAATADTSSVIVRTPPGGAQEAEVAKHLAAGRPVYIVPRKLSPEAWSEAAQNKGM